MGIYRNLKKAYSGKIFLVNPNYKEIADDPCFPNLAQLPEVAEHLLMLIPTRADLRTLEEATKYALISIDSTMRSNMTVGPPVDLVVYPAGSLELRRQCRLGAGDPQLQAMRTRWEQEKAAVVELQERAGGRIGQARLGRRPRTGRASRSWTSRCRNSCGGGGRCVAACGAQ
jgi:predicted proteasome-type protease